MKNMKTGVFSICILMIFTVIFSPLGIADICNNASINSMNDNGNGKWAIEVADGIGKVGWYSDIVVVDSDTVFISYYDIGRENLKFASLNDDGWSWDVVDSTGAVGMYSSMDVDSSGNPHISYYDETNHDLKYAYWNGFEWSIEVVDSDGDVGWDTSIAVDTLGYPHISYHDASNGDLKYAHWTGTDWSIEVVDSNGDTGKLTSIALDLNGNPHISYSNRDDIGLWYAYWTEDSWVVEYVDSEGWIYGSTSIAIDLDGVPHICYYVTIFGHFSLKYAYRSNKGWNVETIDPYLYGFYIASGITIVVDHFERIHIVYYDWSGHCVNYVWKVNGIWNLEVVDGGGFGEESVGAYASLDVDPMGFPHISYYDGSNGDLKYARKIQYSPGVPIRPSGVKNGKPGEKYTYSTTSTDIDGDKIKYGWDWGDNSSIEWTDFYNSGETCEVSHIWDEPGYYEIKVIAEDENGFSSEYHLNVKGDFTQWSDPLSVSMPKNKDSNNKDESNSLEGFKRDSTSSTTSSTSSSTGSSTLLRLRRLIQLLTQKNNYLSTDLI